MKKRVVQTQYALLSLFLAVNVLGQPALSTNVNPQPKPPDKARPLIPGDLIQVGVFQEDDFKLPSRIAPDGTINIPLLERISVGGKTIEQAESFIRDLLDIDYILNPKVTVTVIEYVKWSFTVNGVKGGEVQTPGNYQVSGDVQINLVQALAFAGGVTPKGNGSKVRVFRKVGENLQFTEHDIDDPKAKQFQILPNDIISVPQRLF